MKNSNQFPGNILKECDFDSIPVGDIELLNKYNYQTNVIGWFS